MDRRFAAAGAREDLVGASGDDLVGVHVRLGARAGLPDHQREMIHQRAVGDLLGGLADGRADRLVHDSQLQVGAQSGQFLNAEGLDQRRR